MVKILLSGLLHPLRPRVWVVPITFFFWLHVHTHHLTHVYPPHVHNTIPLAKTQHIIDSCKHTPNMCTPTLPTYILYICTHMNIHTAQHIPQCSTQVCTYHMHTYSLWKTYIRQACSSHMRLSFLLHFMSSLLYLLWCQLPFLLVFLLVWVVRSV